MNVYRKTFLIVLSCIFLFMLIFNFLYKHKSLPHITNLHADTNTVEKYKECENRLNSLEPKEAINIDSYPIYGGPLPTNVRPISEVIEKGKDIPLQFAYNDLNWKRPTYKSYWHSTPTGGRWSYVPTRVNYSLYRIFATYHTASIYYDFAHNLGIWEEGQKFNYDRGNINQILLVTMQSNVEKIMTLDNQVIVIVEPRRTGLQALIIPEDTIHPSNIDESTIFQMVTPDGYEISYAFLRLKE